MEVCACVCVCVCFNVCRREREREAETEEGRAIITVKQNLAKIWVFLFSQWSCGGQQISWCWTDRKTAHLLPCFQTAGSHNRQAEFDSCKAGWPWLEWAAGENPFLSVVSGTGGELTAWLGQEGRGARLEQHHTASSGKADSAV